MIFMTSRILGYMDETGHSSDERQRFNGMVGLIAPSDHWEEFELKWKKTLKDFKIPYFHMVEFENSERAKNSTKSKNMFKTWSVIKKERIIDNLPTKGFVHYHGSYAPRRP